MPPLQNATVRYLVNAIESNSTEFEAEGRVLRLKQYLGINARPPVIDAILDSLKKNTRIEALYIQNFEDVRSATPPRITILSAHVFALTEMSPS